MDGGLRITWGKVITGREKQALELFQDAVTYYGKKMADGSVTYFEPFLLATGDLTIESGFFVIKAPITEIFRILDDGVFKDLNTKAYVVLDHFKVELLAVGEEVTDQLSRYERSLSYVG